MHNYKLKPGINKIYKIDKNTFELTTQQRKPYYSFNSKNERIQFAVCPACDNPIEIIGLYKPLHHTDSPYGRHYPHSINGLAEYNQQAYNYCPYSKNQTTITSEIRKSLLTNFEKDIYLLMREQFDRVIYVLSKQLDIKITYPAAQRMLTTYVKGEGWLYPWATLNNLPWVLGHLSWSKTLYGQPILKNSHLYNAIVKSCPSVEFIKSKYYSEYEILVAKDEMYIDINYCIINHCRKINNNMLTETMDFMVTEGNIENRNIIYRKQLTIDEPYFMNLINLPNERSRRNMKLLEIAKNLMPNLD